MSDQPLTREPLAEENRPRKGRTIDLEATDVTGANAEPEALSGAEATHPPSAEQSSDPAEPSAPTENAAAPPRGRRRYIDWKAMLSGAAGGAVIAAVCAAALPSMIRDPEMRTLDARVSRVESQVRQAGSNAPPNEMDARVVEGLANRVAKLESSVAASGSATPGLADRVSSIERGLKTLSERAGMLSERSEAATASAQEARQRAGANAAAVADLTQKVTRAESAAGRDKMVSEIQSLTNRLVAVESTLAKVRDPSVRLAVAAIALNTAVERGQPYGSELTALKLVGADPTYLAPLEPFAVSGVPTPIALSRELLAIMPSLRATEPTSGGFLTALQSNAEKLVRIRPDREKEASDLAAILARIEFKAGNADISGAVAELASLPPSMRAVTGAWIEKTKARSAAKEASQHLLAAALDGISK